MEHVTVHEPLARRRFAARARIASALGIALVAGLVGVPATADPGPGFTPPEVAPVPAVPVSPVAPVPGPTDTAAPAAAKPAPVWPTGSAVVDLTRLDVAPGILRAEGIPPFGGRARAGNLPVWLSTRDQRLGALRVDVADRESTAKANVAGLLIRIAPTDETRDTRPDRHSRGQVTLDVSYREFASAYGGDWRSRLRLLSLPECALSTPGRDECRATALPSRNNIAAGTVTASVSLAGGSGLFALAAGPSGPAGDYTATTLQPSATWSAGGNSGTFAWSYPMRVPPPPGGPAPVLSLSYSSQSVDGRHAASNNQPSWIGEGFEFVPGGFIERRYKRCADDMDGSANNGEKTGDLCWETDNATLSLSGHAGELIYDAAEDRWRLRRDDGTRIQRLTGAVNGDNNGEHWVVTTTDGTQFWFGLDRLPGWTSGDPLTNSTLTVPVFGNDPGEPCHAGTFDGSDCMQAWRWNLAYVVDVHNNSASYWYVTETNRYARAEDQQDAALYHRASTLSHIAYGTRRSSAPGPEVDSVLDEAAPAKVVFTTADRCLANCASHDEASWPDTPWDNECAAAPCSTGSPTFWTTKRLSSVTTQVWGGTAYRDVERWTFTQTFPDPGDGTRAGLWLSAISHDGLVGGVTSMPDVEFTGVQLANRVDATGDFAAAMNWWRIAKIRSESGGTISVVYSEPDCVAGQPMPEPHTNTRRCYPVRWTPEGYQTPVTDWFHKYVVTTVYEQDHTGGAPPAGSPAVTYRYSYFDGAAWHYTDDDGLIDPENKTWSQWRGYARVGVTVGDPGEQTYAETVFLRGMHGDHLPTGTRTVLVPGTGVPDVPDEDAYAGMVREHTVFNGPGGPMVSKEINEPWQSEPTASRTVNGTTVHARYVSTSASHRRIARDGGRADLVTTTLTFFDSYGMPIKVEELGDVAASGDEACTLTTFEPRNTTAWLMKSAHSIARYAVPCDIAANPAELEEADVIGEARMSYDGQAWLTAPTRGLPTRAEQISDWNSGAPTFVTLERLAYDDNGRVTHAWNALNALSTTTYTPSSGGLVTQITTTNPLNHVTVSTLEPAWGLATSVVDANGKRTDFAYDGLGRLTAVWKPGRDKATETPNLTFGYLVRPDGATAVSTSILHADGQYSTAYTLYDGLLRRRQEQAPSPAGGRVLTDSFYDSAGRPSRSYASYYAAGAAGPDLVTATQATNVPTQSTTVYDGAGRPVQSIFHPYGAARWISTTAYGGDRVDVTPPPGGTATSTVTDALGRTVELRQYHGTTPTPHVDGSWDATTYAYNRKGLLERVSDAAGNDWTFTYDIRGRQITWTDPDKGTVVSTYDDAGRLTSTTDARGVTLAFGYDALDRKRVVWENQPGGALRAQWVYDTVAKGHLTQSTRFVGTSQYRVRVLGYTDDYQPTGTQVVIPATEAGLAGTYTTTSAYNDVDGSLASLTLPGGGDLPAETLTYGYNSLGYPTTLSTVLAPSTNHSLVTETAYNALGHIGQLTLDTDGSAGGRVYRTYTRELETGLVTGLRTDRDSVAPYTVADLRYTRDSAGNIIELTDVAADPVDDTQCFQYDYLRRLVQAWTPATGDCDSDPHSTPMGGPAPYWHEWEFDAVGNRTEQTVHALGGGADAVTSYAYPAPGGPQPHTLTATSGANAGSYAYDSAGNTTCRPAGAAANDCGTGANSQTLTWDAEGLLATSTDASGTTSYIYDADGNRLIRRDPTGRTLYLAGQEIRHTTATGTRKTTRYYTFGGETIASRTAAGLSWLGGDHQGTAQVSIDQATQAATVRRQTPYGEARGGAPAWPNSQGFVGGTMDNTGLTHLGAREYDPRSGRFLSLDPVFGSDDPQQMQGYSYANNSPVTFADPTGLDPGGGHDCHGCSHNTYVIKAMSKPKKVKSVSAPPRGQMTLDEASQTIFGVGISRIQHAPKAMVATELFAECYNFGTPGACLLAMWIIAPPPKKSMWEIIKEITPIGDIEDCIGGDGWQSCAKAGLGVGLTFVPVPAKPLVGFAIKAAVKSIAGFVLDQLKDAEPVGYAEGKLTREGVAWLTERGWQGQVFGPEAVAGLLGVSDRKLTDMANWRSRDFVTLYAALNSPVMRQYQQMIVDAAVTEGSVHVEVEVLARGPDSPPSGVAIKATGAGGFDLTVTVDISNTYPVKNGSGVWGEF